MKKLLSVIACSFLLTACSDHGVPGTYVMDKSQFAKNLDALPAEAKKAFESFDIVATLGADGSCIMTANLPTVAGGGGKQVGKGTYKVEGDQITITVLEQDGKKSDKPDSKTGTLKNGVITLKEMNMEMRLVKK